MGELKLNSLNQSDKQTLETRICPYEFEVLNKSLPTRCGDSNITLIDYSLADKGLPLKSSHVSDCPIQSDQFRAFATFEDIKTENRQPR